MRKTVTFDPAGLPQELRDEFELITERFEEAWSRGQRPAIAEFLPRNNDLLRRIVLRELVHLDLERRIKLGETPTSDEYLAAFPELDSETGFVDSLNGMISRLNLSNFQSKGTAKPVELGNYILLEKIGAGGMGQVFKARHQRMDRIVAVKLLSSKMANDKAAIARFEREVKAAAKISHPNIVTAYDADQANGVHFLVMEFVDGMDLSAFVKRNGPASVDQAVNFILQAARGLEAAHKKGVVHRDMKPSNLLLDLEGTVKILDLGLARIGQNEDPLKDDLTTTGMVMGTVDYMAPEQAQDAKSADARADIYALGCSLYFLLTGKPTYESDSFVNTLLAHRERPIPSLRAIRPDVPEPLEAIFEKMVAKQAGDRYQSMSELIAELSRCHSIEDTRPIVVRQSADPGFDTVIVRDKSADATISLHSVEQATLTTVSPSEPVAKPRPDNGGKRVTWIGGAFVGLSILAIVVATIIGIRPNKVGPPIVENGAKLEPLPVKPAIARVKRPLAFETPGFDQWVEKVAAMSAEEQLNEVSRKLMELNPGFDGKLWGPDGNGPPRIENGQVVELNFFTDLVVDISPLRALTKLWILGCVGSKSGQGRLADLSPLKGLTIPNLFLPDNQISDLSPLRNVAFEGLNLMRCRITDISPLHGKAITTLVLNGSPISDLSPLRKSPLERLYLDSTLVRDLSPVAELPLKLLWIGGTFVSDLSPLKKMPLRDLQLGRAPYSNWEVLKGLPLEHLVLDARLDMDSELLKSIETLRTINERPIAKFLEELDAQRARANVPLAFTQPEFEDWVKKVGGMPTKQQAEEVAKKFVELNPGFDGKVNPTVEAGVIWRLEFIADYVTDLSPVRALKGLVELRCPCSGKVDLVRLRDLSPLRGMPLKRLSLSFTNIEDLSPLSGMELQDLGLYISRVADLSVLEGMPLTRLNLTGNPMADLSPLKGGALKIIHLDQTLVTDLSPLQGMPLTYVACTKMLVTDFSPLKDSPVRELWLDTPERHTELLRSLKTLDMLNFKPVAEFWMEVENEGDFGKLAFQKPGFDEWVKEVATRTPEQQVDAVARKLQELNPGFDGKVTHKVENGAVCVLEFVPDRVTDISPVRALRGLKFLNMQGTENVSVRLRDLSPLNGMPLVWINIANTNVSDLSPLKGMPLDALYGIRTRVFDLSSLQGMPLKVLYLDFTPVSELSPLKGMSLTELGLNNTKVSDLSPLNGMPLTSLMIYGTQTSDLLLLKGMKLRRLHCGGNPITDLSPLKGMPLEHLYLGNCTKVADLTPLKESPLVFLECANTQVFDLSPLAEMNLTGLVFSPEKVTQGINAIREMKTIEAIGIDRYDMRPPDEFWKKYDAGEFGKP